jgi:nucleoside-diphosphate-sugar epimerase
MKSALIGHTGFVGGTLAGQVKFDDCFHSKTIEDIIGRKYDLLVVSGMPAAKWIANRDPDADRAVLDRLWSCLTQAEADTVVIMSTVDVYPVPVGVDEESPIDPAAQHTYGKHRLMLEQRAAERFKRVLRVRLPGLFGAGLKKNIIYDLLHDNEVAKIHPGGVFQFYNLDRLWADVQTALTAGLEVVNFAVEPVSVREVAKEAFGRELAQDPGTTPARYDFRSRHAGLYNGRDGYLYSRAQVLDELRTFVAAEREKVAG